MLNPQLESVFKQINEPIAVISVAGPYRSGKSYLLNRLARTQIGFEVGNLIVGQTRGIWVWGPAVSLGGKRVLLLDTEGLGDPGIGNGKANSHVYDVKLFIFTILASSLFIYNTTRVIDRSSLEELSVVLELTDHIKNNKNNNTGIGCIMPNLLWVIRDFSLTLEIPGKGKITPDQYLDEALKFNTSSKAERSCNPTRDSIKECFPKRTCFVMPGPGVSDEQLKKGIDKIPYETLNISFRSELEKLMALIPQILPYKLGPDGQQFNGPIFWTYLSKCAEAIQKNGEIIIPELYDCVQDINNADTKRKCIGEFDKVIESEFNQANKIFEIDSLNEILNKARKAAYSIYSMQAIGRGEATDKYALELKDDISKKEELLVHKNYENSAIYCQKLFEEVHTLLHENIKRGVYLPPNGKFENYLQDRVVANKAYETKARGPAKANVLASKADDIKRITDNLIQTTKELNESQKEIYKQKEQAEQARIQAIASEAEKEKLLKENIQRAKQHEEHIQALALQQKHQMDMLAQTQNENIKKIQKQMEEATSQKLQEQAEQFEKHLQEEKSLRQEQQQQLIKTLEILENQRQSTSDQINQLNNQLMQSQQQQAPERESIWEKVLGNILPTIATAIIGRITK